MRTRTITSLVMLGALIVAGGAWLMRPTALPSSASAGGGATPDSIYIMAVARDFLSTHPDFNKNGGKGHSAGNVGYSLGSDERPVFAGAGYKVDKQWRDSNANPIPPHLYMMGFGDAGKIYVKQATVSGKHGVLDTYNSASGPYGPSNKGPKPSYVVGATMPGMPVPFAISTLPNKGAVDLTGTQTISSSIHCDTFNGNGTINISGNISILCEKNFALGTGAIVNLIGPATRLTLYLRNGGSSWNHVEFNKNTGVPSRVTVYNLGTSTFMIHNHAEVYAVIVAPNGVVEISNQAALFGRFIGKEIEYDISGDFHVDGAPRTDFCNKAVNDAAGTAGTKSTGDVQSASTFNQWFTDTLGANMSVANLMTLTRDSSGVYQYLDDDFHPVDDILLGNEGQAHNQFFAYAFSVSFTHHACAGGFVEFEGADDLWVFIDGMLGLDLGGIQPGTRQRLDVARFNLVDGQKYRLHLFYAQRSKSSSMFRLRTNLDLIQEYIKPAITVVGD